MKIDSLTPEQEAQLPAIRDEWIKIGLSCDPCDFERAKRAASAAYRAAGLEPPAMWVLCDGPLSGAITAAILRQGVRASVGASVRDSVRASVRASVGDSVRASVGASVRASVRAVGDSVWGSVGASVGDSVRASVGASVRASVRAVGDSVWASVGASVGASVEDSVRASVWDSVWDSVWGSVGASVRASVGASVGASVRASVRAVGDSVWASVGASVGASVEDSVRASVWDSVWGSVGASVGDSVRASVGDSVRASVWGGVYGAHDAGWLSFYDCFRLLGLRQEVAPLAGLLELAKCCGWWIPYQNVCILQHRHSRLSLDDEGRLHDESGMACEYRDGWGVWAINGVRVDEQIVLSPQTQTVEQIRSERNAEVKRLRQERYGWPRYLREVSAERIDQRRNDIEGTREYLYRADDQRILLCACPSTAKEFALEVDDSCETCEQAQSYLSGGLSARIVSAS